MTHARRLTIPVLSIGSFLFLVPGCTFDVSGIGIGSDDGAVIDGLVTDGSTVDAPPDASSVCPPDQTYCDGNVLMTCLPDGSGPVDAGQECEFACGSSQGTDQCLYASNVPATVYTLCETLSVPLTPAAGQSVTISEPAPGAIQIGCSTDCGAGPVIPAAHFVANEAAWFCLSTVDIPAGVTVDYNSAIDESIIWVVDGTVTIAGNIDFSGGNANNTTGGGGGPGGHAGAVASGGVGNAGSGQCAGGGGQRAGAVSNNYVGGGGGGGGMGGMGGTGGDGRTPLDTSTATGGTGGTACGAATLVPLAGGSSGGGGGDGSGGTTGWPSGGGGGAVEIASRASIDITGSLAARGGNGYGVAASLGGGGGGGAGGGLLLEAPTITVSGSLDVNGGNGGQSGAGQGGAGASGVDIDGTNGTDYTAAGQGGSGGGGGGGRIRLNTPDATFACNTFASPQPACTSGALSNTITP